MKKIIAGFIAAATLLSLASCGADTSWAYKSGDDVVTSGMYVGMSISAYQAAQSVEGYDAEKTPFNQTIEEKDGLQWVKDETETTARRYFAVEKKFADMELSVTPETVSYLNSMSETYYAQADAQLGYANKGFGLDSYKKLQENQYKSSVIFNEIYGEGGSEEVPADELKAYFYDKFSKVFYVPVQAYVYDAEGNPTARPEEEIEAEIKTLTEKLNNTDDYQAVINEYFSEEAGYSVSQFMTVVDKEDTANMPESVLEVVTNGEIGSVSTVDDNGTTLVMKKLDITADATDFENNRATALSKLKMNEFNAKIDEWANEIEIEANEAAIKKHNPKNIKF